MPSYIDHLQRDVIICDSPKRIVSLVPSQTELLSDLGLNEEVVGITKFCVHPKEWFQTKTRVGGTKQLHLEKIKSLQPDLIIANKEENVKEQIEALVSDFPVWISDVNNLEDALQMIASIGEIVNRKEKALAITGRIEKSFSDLKILTNTKAAYFIWNKPYMTTGGDTFIHDMMQKAGFENIFCDKLRYPEVTLDEIRQLGCEVLLLSSEPFPFSQKHIDEIQPQLPDTKIILVDGEMFSWYGSRLLKAPEYFHLLQSFFEPLRHGDTE